MKYMCIYLEPVVCPLFSWLNPPKQGHFSIKTRYTMIMMCNVYINPMPSNPACALVNVRQLWLRHSGHVCVELLP